MSASALRDLRARRDKPGQPLLGLARSVAGVRLLQEVRAVAVPAQAQGWRRPSAMSKLSSVRGGRCDLYKNGIEINASVGCTLGHSEHGA